MRQDVKIFVMTSKIRHDVKKFVMMSKICHDVEVQDSTSRGTAVPHPWANNIPLELPLKMVFPGNIPTGLTKFILRTPETEPDSVIPLHQLRMNLMTRYPHNQV